MRITLKRTDTTEAQQDVLAAISEAARPAVAIGVARVGLSTTSSLDGPAAAYDVPVVVLTPTNPASAQVRVEVRRRSYWRLSVAGGPAFEFDSPDYTLLQAMVRIVIAGRYDQQQFAAYA